MKLTALEASFVVFVSSSDTFLRSVDGFTALGALWVFCWLERHFSSSNLSLNQKVKNFLLAEMRMLNKSSNIFQNSNNAWVSKFDLRACRLVSVHIFRALALGTGSSQWFY